MIWYEFIGAGSGWPSHSFDRNMCKQDYPVRRQVVLCKQDCPVWCRVVLCPPLLSCSSWSTCTALPLPLLITLAYGHGLPLSINNKDINTSTTLRLLMLPLPAVIRRRHWPLSYLLNQSHRLQPTLSAPTASWGHRLSWSVWAQKIHYNQPTRCKGKGWCTVGSRMMASFFRISSIKYRWKNSAWYR